jgi:hypothetical protein
VASALAHLARRHQQSLIVAVTEQRHFTLQDLQYGNSPIPHHSETGDKKVRSLAGNVFCKSFIGTCKHFYLYTILEGFAQN